MPQIVSGIEGGSGSELVAGDVEAGSARLRLEGVGDGTQPLFTSGQDSGPRRAQAALLGLRDDLVHQRSPVPNEPC